MDSFSDLGQRVRTHICYAHVFGDALTEEQLVTRCAPADPDGVRRALELLQASGAVERDGAYWFLSGEVVDGFASVRRVRERAAQRVLDEQRGLIGFLKRLRIVRMLAVSGSVSWKNHVDHAGKPADLDLFIITAPSGVHIVRLALLLRESLRGLMSRFGWGRRWAFVCPNYMTEIGFLEVANPSFYTASDSLNVHVLKGDEVYHRFLAANRWIERYYPVPIAAQEATVDGDRSIARAALNAACFAAMAAYAWSKARLTGRPFIYSLRFRFDRTNSLRRSAVGGGGYQPTVARRFHDIHTRHFGPDPDLCSFLFPGTTDTGVHAKGEYAEPTGSTHLGYDE